MTHENGTLSVNCPGCGQRVPWIAERQHRPFCSRRCRESDFCGWATEEHVLAGESSHADIFSEDIE